MIMKRLTFCFLLLHTIAIAVAQKKALVVSNPLSILRKEEVVAIPWSQVMEVYPTLDTANFKVINPETKREYEYQLEYKGQSQVQNLLVQLTIAAGGQQQLQIVKGKHKPFTSKTYCRYVPERKDDFAWENDRIAFRMYGQALENSPAEMAYGVDVWVKRTDRLILNERYKRGEYHIDHGDGMDYYHVGLTLGAGGIAPYIHDTIWFSKNYRAWKVLDNGPLRSTFQLSYEEWPAAGRKIKCTKTISLDAGSQLSKTVVNYETDSDKPLSVVTGIIKRKEAGEMLLNEKEGILAYWEPQHGTDGITGVACLLTTPVRQMLVNKEHLLAETLVPENASLTYYNGAAWNKAGQISSSGDWFKYLQLFQDRLKNQLLISVK
jgi:hypothetical protein